MARTESAMLALRMRCRQTHTGSPDHAARPNQIGNPARKPGFLSLHLGYKASDFRYSRNCGARSSRLSAKSTVAFNMPNLSPAS